MSSPNPALAIVFPGQGSQAVGMMSAWSDEPVIREAFAEASEALGYDLWALVEHGPAETLDQTDRTQPAILTASVALWRLWQERGGAWPAALAGHSLGEYSALVAAGALSLPDAVELVADRGRFMQEAVPAGEGGMAAVLGLEDDQVATLCTEAGQGEVVQPVNYNAPGQVVIAGSRAAVDRAAEAAKAAGAKRVMPLPVSAPSHCSLMRDAAERLSERLEAVSLDVPRVPVLHNVDVATSDDPTEIRRRLVEQLANPVRWTETVQRMAQDGVETLIECGPGKVLTGLTRRIDRNLQGKALGDPGAFDEAIAAFPAQA